eukprot:TRINITY_DN3330_c0_g1_i5.p1 TRINITY_DN3330_c0_g1~~TRINITY_DN3330_c0_g1_i5.p1  ORF type:complete len:359 (+),score=28.58 TRINITY_DN3330_c0_g1_i5:35-1111(+)
MFIPLLLFLTIQNVCAIVKVSTLPGVDNMIDTMYSGYLPIRDGYNSSYFFWFVESRRSPSDPLVVWLQGGPGATSTTGFLLEHGPYLLQDETKLNFNKFSWCNFSNVLYIDQPIGSGLSFAYDSRAYVSSQAQVAKYLYNALLHFYDQFPDYVTNDLYISGESEAGKYVPSSANYILQQNKLSSFKINLKGIAVGNGIVHPIAQRPARVVQSFGSGYVSFDQLPQLEAIERICLQTILTENWSVGGVPCENLLKYLQEVAGLSINVEDIRKFSPTYNVTMKVNYLNSHQLRAALGITDLTPIVNINPIVKKYLFEDKLKSVLGDVESIMNDSTMMCRSLFYNGMWDFRDGPIGTELVC